MPEGFQVGDRSIGRGVGVPPGIARLAGTAPVRSGGGQERCSSRLTPFPAGVHSGLGEPNKSRSRSRPAVVHLHLHTHFSFGIGVSSPEILVQAAAERGFSALACTDTNGVYGAVEFQRA